MENMKTMEILKAASPPRRKIIMVDDVRFQLLSTRERLREHYDIIPAQSSEELFEVLKTVMPELILLDINMPKVNGYEVIKQLKADDRYAEIPVIFLTAVDDRKSVVKGMRLGAADYVTKPFNDSDLIKAVEYQLDSEAREGNKPVILVIDDEPSVLKSINYLLNDQYRVYTLSKPGKMEALLKLVHPDLFLLDIRMPEASGFDLVPVIRKMPMHRETPVVFLTADGTTDNVLRGAIHMEVDDVIAKPINETVLRERMATHLADFVMRRRVRTL